MQFYELLLAAELSISLSRYVNLLAGKRETWQPYNFF